MGRRKERRLAAMSATGRRVKLDLFAEPSGDLGVSSAQNEVGGDDDDTKNQAGLPNSPSSSGIIHGNLESQQGYVTFLGKQGENPLVLLGQYSDDELDEGSTGDQLQAASGDASVILDEQVNLADAEGNEDIGFKEGNSPGAQKVEHLEMENAPELLDSLQKAEVDSATDDNATESGVMPEEIGLKEQASATSDAQCVGDIILGWKIVFHEETNRYYYWNIATGETSWEVPDVLAQATESADGKKDDEDTEEKERDIDSSKLTNQNTEINGSNAYKSSMEVLDEGRGEMLGETKGNHGMEQNHLKSSSPLHGAQNNGTSPGNNLFPRESADVLLTEKNSNTVEFLMYETGIELSSSLMKRSEHLLEQLNSVTRSNCNLQVYNQIQKYVLEVEMRLADMKSLASYGSSLLPFWLHSERRVQQLEVALHDVLQSLESEQIKVVDTGHELHENICDVSGTNPSQKKAIFSSSGDIGAPESAGIVELQKNDEVFGRDVSGTELGGKGEVDGLVGLCEVIPNTVLHSGEDVDMDIDMEVEDATPMSSSTVAEPSGAQYHVPPAGPESAAAGEMFSVPPPPEEDWIPPPPPDNEPFPPPPPDEPPEIPYPQPSDPGAVQSFSYAEQYNMPYTGPNYEYYAQANTNLASSNLYVTAEACQPTISHPALYFEALPGTYGPATLAVNPVEPSVYYSLQDGMSQLPIESSVFHSNTVDKTSISEAMEPLGSHVKMESSSLPKKVNIPAIDGEPKKASLEIQSSQASLLDLATTSVTESVSVPSIPAASAPIAPASASKAQSKVLRKKKGTAVSSLRSNKKVSSMVDKWKAAKEELQEEDEEPKNAYEKFEKKRQREIEEWHAQQIASGEAKNNANFQPLGGDWRERVKRKRAQLVSEALQAAADAVTEGNQQADLDELSRGLPNGWQAYWDDSSKQVYYGNSITSETTWIRPTS